MRPEAGYFAALASAVREIDAPRALGRVIGLRAEAAAIQGIAAPVGGSVRISRSGGRAVEGEVLSSESSRCRVALLEECEGFGAGDVAEFEGTTPLLHVSRRLLGRVIDPLGRPVDGKGPVSGRVPVRLVPKPAAWAPRGRRRRRVAGFALGSCVAARGGTPARRAVYLARLAAEHPGATVAALVGGPPVAVERFREALGPARSRSVVVSEPGRPSAVRARRAARAAAALARFFAAARAARRGEAPAGGDVLLLVDWRVRVGAPAAELGLGVGATSVWAIEEGSARFDVEIDLSDGAAR
jgi:flagellum-specific ATP synthase